MNTPQTSPSTGTRTRTHCRNCNYDLTDISHAQYCPHCGQETSLHPPSVREFVNHFFGNYIAVQSTFAQTLWRLMSRPGALTVDYLEGRKRRYILPLRLYLTISVIVFVFFGVLTASTSDTIKVKADLSQIKSGNITMFSDEHRATFKNGVIECVGLPDWMCGRLKSRFSSPDGLKQAAASLPDRMLKFWAYAMFALVPLFALLLKIVYVNRKFVYGEHVVMALHLHAFWLLAVAVSFASDWMPAITAFAIPIYAIIAMRRVYSDAWWSVLLRAAAISVVYLMMAVIAVAVVAVIALLA